jgi:hypothetical protein
LAAEGNLHRRGDCGDSWLAREVFQHVAIERNLPGGVFVLVFRQRYKSGHYAIGLESGIDLLERSLAAQKQPGADQQDQRERDFSDNQAGA